MGTQAKPISRVAITGKIDAQVKPLFDLLLKKADITPDDLMDEAVRAFIHRNVDLLTADERRRFKRLFVD